MPLPTQPPSGDDSGLYSDIAPRLKFRWGREIKRVFSAFVNDDFEKQSA